MGHQVLLDYSDSGQTLIFFRNIHVQGTWFYFVFSEYYTLNTKACSNGFV